ncbi:MAG: hypothetical protein Q9212_002439 [Teloschistes hypoglaucus]
MCRDLGSTKKKLAKVRKENSEYSRRWQGRIKGQDDFVEDVEKMEREVEEARNETEYFKIEYHDALGREGQLSRQLDDIQKMLGQQEDKEQEDEQTQREIRFLRKENKHLKAMRCSHSDPSKPARDSHASQNSGEHVDGALATNAAVTEQRRPGLPGLQNFSLKNDKLIQKLDKVESSNKAYQSQVEQAKKDKKTAEDDRDRANKELAEADTLRAKAESDSHDAIVARDEAEKAHKSCHRELSETNDTLAEKEILLKEKDDKLGQATSTIDDHEETIRVLKEQLNGETGSRGEVQKANSVIRPLNDQLSKLQEGQKTSEQGFRTQMIAEFEIAKTTLEQEHELECQRIRNEASVSYEAKSKDQFDDYKRGIDAVAQQSRGYQRKCDRVEELFQQLLLDLGLVQETNFDEFREYLLALSRDHKAIKDKLEDEQRRAEELHQAQIRASQDSTRWQGRVNEEVEKYKRLQKAYNTVFQEREDLRSAKSNLTTIKKRLERDIETSEREKSTSRHLNDTRQKEKDDLSRDIEALQQAKKDEEELVTKLKKEKQRGLLTWRNAKIQESIAAGRNPGPSTRRRGRDEMDPDLQDSRDTKQPKNGL